MYSLTAIQIADFKLSTVEWAHKPAEQMKQRVIK